MGSQPSKEKIIENIEYLYSFKVQSVQNLKGGLASLNYLIKKQKRLQMQNQKLEYPKYLFKLLNIHHNNSSRQKQNIYQIQILSKLNNSIPQSSEFLYPKLIKTKQNKFYTKIQFQQTNYIVVLVQFIQGKSGNDNMMVNDQVLKDIGLLLGQLSLSLFQITNQLKINTWRRNQDSVQFSNNVLTNLDQITQHCQSQQQKNKLRASLEDYKQKLNVIHNNQEIRKSLIHGDLHPQNFILYEQKQRIKGIIDFGAVHLDICISDAGSIIFGILSQCYDEKKQFDFEKVSIFLKSFESKFKLSKTQISFLYYMVLKRAFEVYFFGKLLFKFSQQFSKTILQNVLLITGMGSQKFNQILIQCINK